MPIVEPLTAEEWGAEMRAAWPGADLRPEEEIRLMALAQAAYGDGIDALTLARVSGLDLVMIGEWMVPARRREMRLAWAPAAALAAAGGVWAIWSPLGWMLPGVGALWLFLAFNIAGAERRDRYKKALRRERKDNRLAEKARRRDADGWTTEHGAAAYTTSTPAGDQSGGDIGRVEWAVATRRPANRSRLPGAASRRRKTRRRRPAE